MGVMKERYDNLDGLRAFSCVCIIAMHIKANSSYKINDMFFQNVVGAWGHLVALFLMISGFGMFCGYYERFKKGEINLNSFYSKRYIKILPFFATLILIDIIIERGVEHIIQGITETTLVFGLLPNNQLDVVGVGWTLGVIFLFYMLFPFVVFLCWTKRRAVITFVCSVLISLLCSQYFFTDRFVVEGFTARHNILYSFPWIIAGCVVYLFRNRIKEFVSRYRWLWLAGCVALDVAWHYIPWEIEGVDICVLKNLILYLPWLIYAISVKSPILSNRVTKYLSGISLELYLAQMFVFRAVEKTNCLYLFGSGWISFIAVWIAVIVGLIVFIWIWNKVWDVLCKLVKKRIGAVK